MSKAFTKLGREISLAVKQNGPNPGSNPRLRLAIQTAKSLNMPKEKIESAIKRASSKSEGTFGEIVYEGYAPHGIAILVETATDNPTRTVANLRSYFSRAGGALATDELIDAGANDILEDEDGLWIYTTFTGFHHIHALLETKKIEILNSDLQQIPMSTIELNNMDLRKDVLSLIDKIEDDDDVQMVFHNLKDLTDDHT
ncbi:hypothetical protein CHS0354_024171 [Potamilus streckersoni]|uniref:Transcriptional regulatory protein n=1 Tax=Potamilus streckersoni TaxID=2493646 RepID=A0AAE0VMT5_9BIVA|nr:hypothetical protein CHS0354_024171 [Potamilus streckersoni]